MHEIHQVLRLVEHLFIKLEADLNDSNINLLLYICSGFCFLFLFVCFFLHILPLIR
jgi:hypothetical protein